MYAASKVSNGPSSFFNKFEKRGKFGLDSSFHHGCLPDIFFDLRKSALEYDNFRKIKNAIKEGEREEEEERRKKERERKEKENRFRSKPAPSLRYFCTVVFYV